MKRLLLALIGLNFALAPTVIQADEVKRHILALYKSSEGDSAGRNETVDLLEQPLESLGYVVDYQDVDKGFPSDAQMSPYRGVITFFRSDKMRNAAAYATWFAHQAQQGRRMLVFGEYGAFQDLSSGAFPSHAVINRAFSAINLRYDGFGTANKSLITVKNVDENMLSFEQAFPTDHVESYVLVRPLSANATAYLTLERTDVPNSLSTPVVITKTGAFASRDHLLYVYEQAGVRKQRWHLNPYAFLRLALGDEKQPYFSLSALNGRRLWMAQMDGDGLLTSSHAGLLCGQSMLENVFSKFQFPFSVAVIGGEINGNKRAQELAQKIFTLANVEPASHSQSHPIDWTGVNIANEVSGSIQFLNQTVTTKEKPIRLFTWSGMANPSAAALRALDAAHVPGMNGINMAGGFVNRFDALYPSRTHLGPSTHHVGNEVQFNHRAANDFALTQEWAEDQRGGYADILTTFKRTRSDPEIPVHLYFHGYSAQSSESLAALTKVLNWSLREPLNRMFVSDYIRLVQGFRTARVELAKDGRTEVTNNGECRTLVFAGSDLNVDFARSVNVLGFTHRDGRLEVFLDENPTHTIALTDQKPTQLYLASASVGIAKWANTDQGLTFQTKGIGPTTVSLGAASGVYKIKINDHTQVVRASDGQATFEFNATGEDTVKVESTHIARAAAQWAGFPLIAITLTAFPILFFIRLRKELA